MRIMFDVPSRLNYSTDYHGIFIHAVIVSSAENNIMYVDPEKKMLFTRERKVIN